MKKQSILLTPILLLLASIAVNAQYTGSYTGAWSTTWNNPISSYASVLIQGHINKKMLERSIANQKGKATRSTAAASASTSAPAKPGNTTPVANYAVLRFRPIEIGR